MKRRRRVKGKEGLEQTVYTRKRLRLESGWMSKFVKLQRDDRGFSTQEVEVIMAYYPGKPINKHRARTTRTNLKFSIP